MTQSEPMIVNVVTGLSCDLAAIVLLTAAVLKWGSLSRFRESLTFIPFLPPGRIPLVTLLVPIAETALGIGLLFREALAIWGAILLFTGLAALSLYTIRKGLKVPCACFGHFSEGMTLSIHTGVINVILALLLVGSVASGTASPTSILTISVSAGVAMSAALIINTFSNEKRKRELTKWLHG